jgi:replicative DNA helicase Mcm
MRLSPIATGEDAERAIRLYLAFLKSVGIDVESGAIDIDAVITGVPASRREAYIKVVELLKKLEETERPCEDRHVEGRGRENWGSPRQRYSGL